jgi:hypothetical protein
VQVNPGLSLGLNKLAIDEEFGGGDGGRALEANTNLLQAPQREIQINKSNFIWRHRGHGAFLRHRE